MSHGNPGHILTPRDQTTYLAGLSGGGWLVGSIYNNNFSSVQTLRDGFPGSSVWKFGNSIFEGPEQNFQILKLMSDDSDVKKIIEDKTTSKNYPYHLISFTTKDYTTRKKTVEPLMKYLNNSVYYNKIQKEYVNNVHEKIKANDIIIAQIDAFLNGLSRSDAAKDNKLVYYSENSQLNDVIEIKDRLLKEQGNNRIDLVNIDQIEKESNSILNIENKTAVNGKLKFVLPFILVLIYLGIFFFIRFYKAQSLKYENKQN